MELLMSETTEMTISLHLFFIFLTTSAVIVNLVTVFVFKDFIKVAKIIKLVTPMFHFFLSTVIFTGLILAVFIKRYFTFEIALMVIVSLLMLGLEITRYVKQKRGLKGGDEQKAAFVSFAKKVYVLDIVLLCITYLVSA